MKPAEQPSGTIHILIQFPSQKVLCSDNHCYEIRSKQQTTASSQPGGYRPYPGKTHHLSPVEQSDKGTGNPHHGTNQRFCPDMLRIHSITNCV